MTTLLVPGGNDSDAELASLAGWLAAVDRDMPWHVSAFVPAYRMTDVPPTPSAALARAVRLGRAAGLRHVYTGNVETGAEPDTRCPDCGAMLIRRRGFGVIENQLAAGRCPACRRSIAGVWSGQEGP